MCRTIGERISFIAITVLAWGHFKAPGKLGTCFPCCVPRHIHVLTGAPSPEPSRSVRAQRGRGRHQGGRHEELQQDGPPRPGARRAHRVLRIGQ